MNRPIWYSRVVIDQQNRNHKLNGIPFSWITLEKNDGLRIYELVIISLAKGIILKTKISTDNIQKLKQFFMEKGVNSYTETPNEHNTITMIIEDIITFGIPDIIQ